MNTINAMMSPTVLTYGMIGLTTIVLAAVTLYDSAEDDDIEESEEPSYVSQLFQSSDADKPSAPEVQETGLVSSLLSGPSNSVSGGKYKKTRRNRHEKNKNMKHKKTSRKHRTH